MSFQSGVRDAHKRTFRQVAIAVLACTRLCRISNAIKAEDTVESLVAEGTGLPELKRLSEAFMRENWGRVELSRSEFIAALVQTFDWDARPDLAECLYNAAEKHGDQVDSRLFSISLAARILWSVEESLLFIFYLFDRHGAGLLDPGEFMDLMLAMTHEGDTSCGLGHHEVTRLFDEIDTNHNGFIDKKELLGLVKSKPGVIHRIMRCAAHGIRTLKRREFLKEDERIMLRKGGCLFVYQDAIFKSSWVERYCAIGGGHLIIHRGKTSTTAVDRVVKLAHGRLSKIVPEAVRLRLETPQEVLLLEAENPQISAAWIKLFHNEGLECSPDLFHGGPISPVRLVEMRKQTESSLASPRVFQFYSPPVARAAHARNGKNLQKRISMPVLQVPASDMGITGRRLSQELPNLQEDDDPQSIPARLEPPKLTRSRSLTSRQSYVGTRLASSSSDPDRLPFAS